MNWCPAQIPRTGKSARSMYSPFRPIALASTPTRGAPPLRTSPSTSASSSKGVVFGTIFDSIPRYFRTRHSRWVHWPPLSTTYTRIGSS